MVYDTVPSPKLPDPEMGHLDLSDIQERQAGDNSQKDTKPKLDSRSATHNTAILSETFMSGFPLPFDEYDESVVTLREYYDSKVRDKLTFKTAKNYFLSMFPFYKWILHYNFEWLYSDFIAGITVGCVLVPQSMSYAQLATLDAQYGLYSSFVGAFMYSFLATAKDVCIGPVAVMSLETAKAIVRVQEKLPADSAVPAHVIATALALIAGILTTIMGFLRLGFIVDFIPVTGVFGFMTGGAITIICSQLPTFFGLGKLVGTNQATFEIIISVLRNLRHADLNTAFGIIPLFMLTLWKWLCTSGGQHLINRYLSHNHAKALQWNSILVYIGALRIGIVIILTTCISWALFKDDEKPPVSTIGVVPSGIQELGVPKIPSSLFQLLLPELPPTMILIILEHIAVTKSFGRINNYRSSPNQELIAVGSTNVVSTFFASYPITATFSRSALKAKCNVKTPLSGIFTGACVLLALYSLTKAFYYIPKATLSAVIIHAVADLICSYKIPVFLWKTNQVECVGFFLTVLIMIFTTIENGIYFSIAWAGALLLFKIAFPEGQFLGYVDVAELMTSTDIPAGNNGVKSNPTQTELESFNHKGIYGIEEIQQPSYEKGLRFHRKWLPVKHRYTRELHCDAEVHPPPDGVIVYRLSESWTYINCSRHFDIIMDEVRRTTRPGSAPSADKSQRLWCDQGPWQPPKLLRRVLHNVPSDSGSSTPRDDRPLLQILAMDWSQVTQVDSTSIMCLIDLQRSLNAYAGSTVEIHFSGIVSPWIKRALLGSGFGVPAIPPFPNRNSVYEVVRNPAFLSKEPDSAPSLLSVQGTNTPFFHLSMPDFEKWNF